MVAHGEYAADMNHWALPVHKHSVLTSTGSPESQQAQATSSADATGN